MFPLGPIFRDLILVSADEIQIYDVSHEKIQPVYKRQVRVGWRLFENLTPGPGPGKKKTITRGSQQAYART
jgi:hypothetical protein